MLVFASICLAGFLILLGGSLFGHDHDHDHDADHGDHGHGGDHGNEPTVSIFSPKIIGTFIMSFGAGGFVAKVQGASQIKASLCGLATGFVLSALMYFVLKLIYSQQASSLVSTDSLIGMKAMVTVPLGANSTGQVRLTVNDQSRTYLAVSKRGDIGKGTVVEVVGNNAGTLVVN